LAPDMSRAWGPSAGALEPRATREPHGMVGYVRQFIVPANLKGGK